MCLLYGGSEEGEAEKNKELQKQLRLGLVECLNHGLLHPYPVLHEKAGELVAQVKATVLLMPNGSDRITVAPSQVSTANSQDCHATQLHDMVPTGSIRSGIDIYVCNSTMLSLLFGAREPMHDAEPAHDLSGS